MKTKLKFQSMVAKSSAERRSVGLIKPGLAYDLYNHETPSYIHIVVTHVEDCYSKSMKQSGIPVVYSTYRPSYNDLNKKLEEVKNGKGFPEHIPTYIPADPTFILTRQRMIDTQFAFNCFDKPSDHVGITYDKQKDAIVLVDLKHIVGYCRKYGSGYSDFTHPYYDVFRGFRGVEEEYHDLRKIKNPESAASRFFTKTIRYIKLPKLNQLDYAYKQELVLGLHGDVSVKRELK